MMDNDIFTAQGHTSLQNARRYWDDSFAQLQTLIRLSFLHGERLASDQFRAGRTTLDSLEQLLPGILSLGTNTGFSDYLLDAGQRWILFLDTLCRRGDEAIEREQEEFKPVLAFDYDVVIDGRKLPRPVNYALVRVEPPPGMNQTRADARPWVIIDPRAGQGSGIGGLKGESEVGVALRYGHPVYFVIFYRDPEPNQTLADVCDAEARFLREVHSRHPNAPKPLVTGNCQGGWAAMILAATHPDLMGPVVIAGAPLSYWAGHLGRNPFRYFGGLAGGGVPAAVISDLGGGKFDGANLVLNFEMLNPGKNWFRKNFDLFANVDSESNRFLEFEKWWSGFYLMNAEEIRWIVENLFIGNRLTRGEAVLDDGIRVDLNHIEVPVIVFASHGDNITPPSQALNWICDLFSSEKEIEASGRIIIYTLHDSIGHLGIFVSAQVANEHHEQIGSVVKTIESLAPGLYEMLIESGREGTTVSFEARKMSDILKFDDGRDEEIEFAATSGWSEWAVKTYELTLQPMIRSMVTPALAEAQRHLHPMRQQYYFYSRRNPLLASIGDLANEVRRRREPLSVGNPLVKLEHFVADQIERSLDTQREIRDAGIEFAFHSLYGTPWMRELGKARGPRHQSRDTARLPHVQDVLKRANVGGYAEGIIRMLVLLARTRGSVRRDRLERSNLLLHSRRPFKLMSPEFRSRLIYEQSLIVEFAGDDAVSTLADILSDPVDRYNALNLVLEIAGPIQEMDESTIAMFRRFQGALLTMAHEWRDPDLGDGRAPGFARNSSSP